MKLRLSEDLVVYTEDFSTKDHYVKGKASQLNVQDEVP